MTNTSKFRRSALRGRGGEKNGRRICLISHATALTHTQTAPKNLSPEVKR